MKAKVITGDMLPTLDKMYENGVQFDACVTDAPYHIQSIVSRFGKIGSKSYTYGQFNRLSQNFIGKDWDDGDIAFKSSTWKKVLRVLKPGAYLVVFGFDKNYHKLVSAIEKSGFEIRRMIIWCSAQYFPKAHHIGKKYKQDTGKDDFLGFYTDIKSAYEPIVLARKPLDGNNIQNLKKHKTGLLNVEGTKINRGKNKSWPTNLLLHEHTLIKQALGSKASFFYCPKPTKKEKNDAVMNNHPTPKPINLMRYLVRMVGRKGARILDPFAGSGTTGIAALKENMSFVGIEEDATYAKIAKDRLDHAKKQIKTKGVKNKQGNKTVKRKL